MPVGNPYSGVLPINSQYVPQFVGSNYNELEETAKVLDTRYRENKNYSDKVAMMMAQDQYLSQDQAIKDKMAQHVYGSIDKIAGSEQNFENSTAAVSQLARDYFTNQERIMAVNNFKEAQKTRELQTRLGANFLNFGDNPDTFTTVDPATGQPRRFTGRVEERADYSKKMQELLGRVADDGYTIAPNGEKITYNDYERYLIKSGMVNHLSKDKLNRLVEGLLPTYKTTGEGQQDIRRLTNLAGFTNQPITVKNGKITRQTTDVDEDIRQRFRSLAAPQAFSKTSQRWDDFGLPVGKKEKNLASVYTPTNPSSVTDNTSLNPLRETSNDTMIKEGNGYVQYRNKIDGSILPVSSNPLYGGATPDAQQIDDLNERYEKVPVDPEQVNSDFNNKFNYTKNQLPMTESWFTGVDDYKAAYTQAVKNHAKITATGNTLAPEQAQQYDDLITRQAVSSPLYFKEASKPTEGLEGLAKKIGTSPSNIELKATNVFYDSPRADIPGGYVEAKVIVKDSKVKEHPTSVFIPLNDQFVALSQPIDQLYKNSFYAGADTYTPEKPYIPQVGERPLTDPATGETMAFYTVTVPLPKNQQKEGQPGFRTFVYPGVITANGSGGQDIHWNNDPMPIGQWKQFMIQALSPLFKNALNSGQTFNEKDFKNQGLQY